MCLTSDAVYRIRDADAIFRIERKEDQMANRFEIHSFFLRMVQPFYRRYLQNTTNNVTGTQEDHDRSRYAAYSVKRPIEGGARQDGRGRHC